jgi:Ca2+-binding EF-hand superfamily protein
VPGPPTATPTPDVQGKAVINTDAKALAKALELHDLDKDGMINKREYREWIGEVRTFENFDLDDDGKLGPAELMAFLKQRPKALQPK